MIWWFNRKIRLGTHPSTTYSVSLIDNEMDPKVRSDIEKTLLKKEWNHELHPSIVEWFISSSSSLSWGQQYSTQGHPRGGPCDPVLAFYYGERGTAAKTNSRAANPNKPLLQQRVEVDVESSTGWHLCWLSYLGTQAWTKRVCSRNAIASKQGREEHQHSQNYHQGSKQDM